MKMCEGCTRSGEGVKRCWGPGYYSPKNILKWQNNFFGLRVLSNDSRGSCLSYPLYSPLHDQNYVIVLILDIVEVIENCLL